MGYKVKPKQYRLKFRDAEFEGLEVIMGSLTVGEWEQMMAPAGADRGKANDDVLELFASRVISWNLEDAQDKVVPCTLAAVKALDRPFVTQLIAAWQLAVIGVDPTSAPASPDGGETGDPVTAEELEMLAGASSPGS